MEEGEKLRRFLKGLPCNMTQTAALMDMTPQNLNFHLRKERLDANFLHTLKEKLGIEKKESGFLIVENKFEGIVANEPRPHYSNLKVTIHEKDDGIPIYDIVARGGSGATHSQVPEVPSYWLSMPGYEDCNFGMYVFGHSMYPTIENGSLILCREIKDMSIILYGEIYLIRTHDGLFVKELQKPKETNKIETHVVCVSHNQSTDKDRKYNNFEPFDLPKNKILTLYIIKGIIKKTQI